MDQEKMYGVVNGLYLCENENHVNINDSFYKRNIPDHKLEAQFAFRAVPTKYVKFPTLHVRPTNNESEERNFYEVSDTFNPGNDKGPYSGYIKNIDLENNLRNSYFGLQKCNQSVYVPNSTSDLYKETIHGNNEIPPSQLSHPLLFDRQDFKPFNPDKSSNSIDIFNNHTRGQRTKPK
jgi:hypothetical protein